MYLHEYSFLSIKMFICHKVHQINLHLTDI